MKKLIIHVGPGKCGSSSIQYFFKRHEKPCAEKLKFVKLTPNDISRINVNEPSENYIGPFQNLFKSCSKSCEALILSHEVLFQNPLAIKNICKIAANRIGDILIIGYSRRQSEFIISAYSQWFFRSSERVAEIAAELEKNDINPLLFNGLEKQLIASILNDFYSARQLSGVSILDWYSQYSNIFAESAAFDAKIICGTLPARNSGISLIRDFCKRAGLTLRENLKQSNNLIANESFNHSLIEAINNAITYGFEIPGAHERNEEISLMSSKMAPVNFSKTKFIKMLKRYIDGYYLESNNKLCENYNIDNSYFDVDKKTTKIQITEIIHQELNLREEDKDSIINYYRKLAAEGIASFFVEYSTKSGPGTKV